MWVVLDFSASLVAQLSCPVLIMAGQHMITAVHALVVLVCEILLIRFIASLWWDPVESKSLRMREPYERILLENLRTVGLVVLWCGWGWNGKWNCWKEKTGEKTQRRWFNLCFYYIISPHESPIRRDPEKTVTAVNHSFKKTKREKKSSCTYEYLLHKIYL